MITFVKTIFESLCLYYIITLSSLVCHVIFTISLKSFNYLSACRQEIFYMVSGAHFKFSLYTVQAIRAFDPYVLENVDGASWKCLSGVCVNRQIIQLVPNMKVNLIRFIHILLSFFIYFIRLCAFLSFRPNVVSHCITLFLIYNRFYSSAFVSANVFLSVLDQVSLLFCY